MYWKKPHDTQNLNSEPTPRKLNFHTPLGDPRLLEQLPPKSILFTLRSCDSQDLISLHLIGTQRKLILYRKGPKTARQPDPGLKSPPSHRGKEGTRRAKRQRDNPRQTPAASGEEE